MTRRVSSVTTEMNSSGWFGIDPISCLVEFTEPPSYRFYGEKAVDWALKTFLKDDSNPPYCWQEGQNQRGLQCINFRGDAKIHYTWNMDPSKAGSEDIQATRQYLEQQRLREEEKRQQKLNTLDDWDLLPDADPPPFHAWIKR